MSVKLEYVWLDGYKAFAVKQKLKKSLAVNYQTCLIGLLMDPPPNKLLVDHLIVF